jgi:hypothetical protein
MPQFNPIGYVDPDTVIYRGFDIIEYVHQCFIFDADGCVAIPQRTRGGLVGGFVENNVIEMWFDSPDGDSSDVQKFAMHCVDGDQAESIWASHRKVWGL